MASGNPIVRAQQERDKLAMKNNYLSAQVKQLQDQLDKANKRVEGYKIQADAVWHMYAGILMTAGTIGEARRWTATVYAELCDLCDGEHTREEVKALLERNGLTMKINIVEIGQDESGAIYNMVREK
jgi:hypothetical protein